MYIIIILVFLLLVIYSNKEKFTNNPQHDTNTNNTSVNPLTRSSNTSSNNPGISDSSNTGSTNTRSTNPQHTFPPVIKETKDNKENLEEVVYDKSKFDKLDPFFFNQGGKFTAGFKSNYVRETFPETVVPNSKGQLEFKQQNLVPFLLAGIKDLNQKNIDLTRNIVETGQMIVPLKNKSDSLKNCLKKIVTPQQCKSLFEEYE